MKNLTEAEYKLLCDIMIDYCDQNISEEKLYAIKVMYEDQINSYRQLESIGNMTDLINVLEKRDCLSHNDITILLQIAGYLNVRQLLNITNIEKFEKPTIGTFNGSRIENSQLNNTESMYFNNPRL